MRKGGTTLKRDLTAAASVATGGDLVYSGAGGKLGVTLSVRQGGTTTTVTLKPQKRTASQFKWANEGTRAGRRRSRRGRSRYVMNHPGTSGRGAWDRTVERGLPKVMKQLEADIAGSVR